MSSPAHTDPCPYPGLRAFFTDERDWYFGREAHVDAMLTCLESSRFLAVVGSSGSGKSSLVFAGLIPALQEGQLAGSRRDTEGAPAPWDVVSFDPGNDPLQELVNAITKAARDRDDPHLGGYVRAALLSGDCGLTEALDVAGLLDPHRETLVYADQFEELFRFAEMSSRVAQENALRFAQLFVAGTEQQDVRLHILLSMRSEFIGECERFSGLPEIVSRSQFLTPRVNRAQLEQALRCPAEAVGWRFASDALSTLINDCGNSPDQLPLAQHILRRMWMRAAGEGRKELTLDDYTTQGGIKNSIAKHGDEILGRLESGGLEVARVLFMALCEQREDGPLVRRLSNRTEVADIAGESALVPEVIARFAGDDPGFIYESKGALDIRHEAVLRQWPQVSKWRVREADARVWLKELSQAAIDFEKDPHTTELWRGKDLRGAQEWRNTEKPSETWAKRHSVNNWAQCIRFLDRSEEVSRLNQTSALEVRETERQPHVLDRVGEYRSRLAIHAVWHPRFTRGAEIAERIYAHFSRDSSRSDGRGLGIPVFFWSASAPGQAVPPPVAVDHARHTAIVVLIDANMVIADGWDDYVTDLWERVTAVPGQHRFLPVALHDIAFALSPKLKAISFTRLQNLAPDDSLAPFLNVLTIELVRLITQRPSLTAPDEPARPGVGPAPMRIYISHAKRDGEETARALRDCIFQYHLDLDPFFDRIHIASGSLWDELDSAIESTSAFVVVQTDAYASSVWCQHEVIRAKRSWRPVVVIQAIEKSEVRSSPYIGNVPTIRWRTGDPDQKHPEAVVGLILREVLHAEYFRRDFEDLKQLFGVPDAVRALPCAPELLTCLALRAESRRVPYFVYPDPPLARQELDLLTELDPNLRLTTPTQLFANPAQPVPMTGQDAERAAVGWRIGLSIAGSADLQLRGLGLTHLRDAVAEFARFLLAAGATLAHGGDFRQGGFAEVLFGQVRAYRAMTGETVKAVQSYLAWPIHLDLDITQQETWADTAWFHSIPPPADVGIDISSITSATDLPPTTPENRVAWVRSLTTMREQMNSEIDARLLFGGGIRGLGKYPGLAEEALLAFRAGKPVYLVGAFGGCAKAVIDALRGNQPTSLTLDFQASDPGSLATIERYNAQLPLGGEPIDYSALVAEFRKEGIEGLRNGLLRDENERLFTTTHLPEMIALVLRGLTRLGPSPASRS